MPPFPPPPFIDAPAYIMPHPHMQPVDYRRVLNSQVHVPGAPYQNANQTHRVRPAHTVPVPDTVSCAVQTEPPHRHRGADDRSPLVSSDSGQGTASSTPSPQSARSRRQESEADNVPLPSTDANADNQVLRKCSSSSSVKNDLNLPHHTATRVLQSCIRASLETQKRLAENGGQDNVGRCNMWSLSSPDTVVPVCTSSQCEDDAAKERRTSVPDILMGGGGTPQAPLQDMAGDVLPQNEEKLLSCPTPVEHEKSDPSPTETENEPMVAGVSCTGNTGETPGELFMHLRREDDSVSQQNSLNKSLNALDSQEADGDKCPHEDTPAVIQTSLRKMNESVWSVESLAAFIPSKEWLMQNVFEPEMIVETIKEVDNDRLSNPNDMMDKASQDTSQNLKMCPSDSWLGFSTPAQRINPGENRTAESEFDVSDMRGPLNQEVAPSHKDPSSFLQRNILLPEEDDVAELRSSEPVALESPNQECPLVPKQQLERPSSPDREEIVPSNSAAEQRNVSCQQTLKNLEDMKAANEAQGGKCPQLCVPDQDTDQVSPSKGHLVDCGVQCNMHVKNPGTVPLL